MNRLILLSLSLFTIVIYPTVKVKGQESPYQLKLKIDIPVTAIAMTGAILTYPLRDKKPTLDSMTIVSMNKSSLPRIEQNATTMYDEKSVLPSDLLFYSSFAFPFFLIADKEIRNDAGTMVLLYLQAVSLGGLADGICAGTVNKARPYVYNPNVVYVTKTKPNATGSFYGSHPSFTSLSSFFVAKVYSDYHPDSRLKPWIWGGASAVTLASSIYRYRTGSHFISDMAFGVGLGAALGILIPEIHRKKKSNKVSLSYFPSGASLTLSF